MVFEPTPRISIQRTAIRPLLSEAAGVPLYETVKRHLSEEILIGRWLPGTVLPGEVALARGFGVAVGTVRRALAELTAEGLLTRRRKTGTVVTGRRPHHSLRSFFQYFRLHALDGSVVRSSARVVGIELGNASPAESAKLELSAGNRVVRLRRVRSVGGIPVMHDLMVIPADRVPGFPLSAGDVPELVYLHLLERYGIRISAVREEITAGLADERDLELLELEPPAALLVMDELGFDQAGTPTILNHHRAQTARHCYVNEVT
ncbi:MAG: GntR family transcriptional regulator [Alphaproteobacteria bacterium]|nr:GntR family transcriptional regulator [Alphaproteobacteria bacterium]